MKRWSVTASSAKPKHLAMLEEDTEDQNQCTIIPCDFYPKNPINIAMKKKNFDFS
jgi:hypothetical protein